MTDTRPRSWIIVTGSGVKAGDEEKLAATRVGVLLAREGYGLVAGTWAGVDEAVTRSFVDALPQAVVGERVVHVDNSPLLSRHGIRKGRVFRSSASDPYSEEAVRFANAGIVVGGRHGSKPTMDALVELGKRVLPFAWLGAEIRGASRKS